MKKTIFMLICFSMIGCATTNESRCRSWVDDGRMMGTVPSCAQCLDTLGSSNLDAVRGCALGLDAAKLLQSRTH